MRRRSLLVVFLMLPAWLQAQNPDPATRELIEKLMSRIDSLEKRVVELEQGKAPLAAAAVAPAAAPSQAAAVAAHDHNQAPLPDENQPVYPSLKISGFADVDFSATDLHGASGGFGAQTLLGAHSGFALGQYVLHLSSALSPKVTVFSELSMTARSDAGTGTPPATGFNTEVERIIIRYDLNDRFKLSFGRYHTPINYWNTAFHHGAWLQTTIARPDMVAFGGRFIPVHFVGAQSEGSVPSGTLGMGYNLGIGNGRSTNIARGG